MIKKRRLAISLVIIIIGSLLVACFPLEEEGVLSVHIIDVGQGDSILIRTPQNKSILIDGGEAWAGKTVASYLRKYRLAKIDILIASHPHSDHIGGLVNIIENFQVDSLYMPDKIHTSKTFEQLLDAIEDKGLEITIPNENTVVELEEDISLLFLGPLRDYGENLNNWSIVNKLIHGENSFLFTGDMEAAAEKDLVKNYPGNILRSQVLKVAHHGSNTSSTEIFLDTIRPKVAVISSGKDNLYNHPHDDIIKSLQDLNTAIYSTQDQGTIIIKSDGLRIWSHQKPHYN